MSDPPSMQLKDSVYQPLPYLITFAWVKAQMVGTILCCIKYRKQTFDCDDFAVVMMGMERLQLDKVRKAEGGSTFGYVDGAIKFEGDDEAKAHAMNFFVDENEKVWLVEPQTGSIRSIDEFTGRIDHVFV